ncbi:MAG: efflux RND transporter permease subunit, partial [Dinghuibacter sp.]|nr:efflux RND transporter permease subunit [Dinghuibacter sp.]
LLFGLGIIVDDAIVVIENTHRIYNNGKVPVDKAAKMAAGEIFIPVLAGTLTTLAPFFPLLMWKGLIGKFMIYLPVMLILTLTASLIVAFIINPVFAVSFMRPEGKEHERPAREIFKKWWFYGLIIMGLLMNFGGQPAFGNFLVVLALLVVFNQFVLRRLIHGFQHNILPRLMNRYENGLRWALKGKRPVYLVVATFGLFIISVVAMALRSPNVVLFPQGDPNNIFVYLKMPVGSNTSYTDSVVKQLEKKVDEVIKKQKAEPAVESIISNVALGAGDPRDANRSIQPNLGRIQIAFHNFEKRHGMPTTPIMDALRENIKGIPGATVTVAPEVNGPPTEPPVNIEIKGDDFDKIAKVATDLKNFIDNNRVEGIEELKLNVDLNNPEVTINVNRERCLTEGLSTAQIGMEIRTAVFGKEISKLKDNEDEYKIQLRYSDLKRNSLTDLLNMKITYRDFNTGAIRQVPIGSVVTPEFTSTSGGIFRKQYKRTIAITSNVLQMEKVTAINQELAKVINNFKSGYQLPSDITIAQAGESEQQKEMASFLGSALVIALLMIFLILVLQFNSISKPFIVLNEIFFSVIGVFLGIAITGMNLSVIMVGVGIVGLAGIVVKNGILLIEFTDELRSRGMRMREATIQAGKIRIIPVLLTALATMLGLVPLAVGLNIDFLSLLKTGNPKLFFGGDSVVFWGPLSWTIIFGLIFAFFMTLLMVPSMYIIAERLKRPMAKFY